MDARSMQKCVKCISCAIWRCLRWPFWTNGRFRLWFAVLFCLLVAVAIFTFLGWLWIAPPAGEGSFWIIWRLDVPSNDLDIIRVVLTAIGGFGGIVYLVIRYRERTDAEAELTRKEQETADRRLNDAVQQLGSESPQVRIAGVYAIVDVADTYLGHYKQRAVDILAGYLRTNRGSKEDDTFKDAAVESTILKVFSDHLKKDQNMVYGVQVVSDEQLWSRYHIDLHGAVIHEKVDFSFASLSGLDCANVEFLSAVNFSFASLNYLDCTKAKFHSDVKFRSSIFNGISRFGQASFDDIASFSEALFSQEAMFENVTFRDRLYFDDVTFNRGLGFKKAEVFGEARFSNSKFIGKGSFEGAIFKKDVGFQSVKFIDRSVFSDTEFFGNCYFGEVKFYKGAIFSKALFDKLIYFNDAYFGGESLFVQSKFNSIVDFEKVEFSGGVNFAEADFSKEAIFSEANFKKPANFQGVSFDAGANFEAAILRESSEQNRPLTKSDLSGATFSEEPIFSEDSPTEED